MHRYRRFTFASLLMVLLCVPAGLVPAQTARRQLDDALIAAVKNNDTQAVLAALKAGADANAHEVFQSMLPRPFSSEEDDTKPTTVSLSALYLAVGWRINTCPPPLFRHFPPRLVYCVQRPANTAIVKALLEAGANPRETNPFCDLFTPLMTLHQVDTMRLLLDRGADVNARGEYGPSLLISVLFRHFQPPYEAIDTRMFALLLEKGADFQSRSIGGTPLIFAVFCRSEICVRLLLDKGANINAQDEDGTTPLKAAVIGHWKEGVKLLLARHADITIEDNRGNNVLFYAIRYHQTEIIRLLKQAGAKE